MSAQIGGDMLPLDANKEFIVNVGRDSTSYAQQWFINKIFELVKLSKPTKFIKNQDTVVYEAHLNRYSLNPFWINHLGISDLGYFEISGIDGKIYIRYKMLFHEATLLFLYYSFIIIFFIILTGVPILPLGLGIIFLFLVACASSYFGTLISLNLIIREFISDYLFMIKQEDFNQEIIL